LGSSTDVRSKHPRLYFDDDITATFSGDFVDNDPPIISITSSKEAKTAKAVTKTGQ